MESPKAYQHQWDEAQAIQRQRQIEASRRSRRRFRNALGALSLLAMSATSSYQSDEVLVAPPGCAALPAVGVADDSAPNIRQADNEHANIETFEDNLDISVFKVAEFIREATDFQIVERFTSSHSGINLAIYSDGEIFIHQTELDDLLHLNLAVHAEYDDPRAKALMGCYNDRVIAKQEFAGSTLHLMAPSNPRTCLKDLSFNTRTAKDSYQTSCDYGGFTPPLLNSAFTHSGFNQLKVKKSHYLMIVAPGSIAEPVVAEDRFSRVLVHESGHLWPALTGLPPRIKADERAARYIEEEILQSSQARLPHAISYKTIN